MRGILAAILLLIGIVNLTSEASGFIGWLLVVLGGILLIYELSGPMRPRKHSIPDSSVDNDSDYHDSDDSDFSIGDGGGDGSD